MHKISKAAWLACIVLGTLGPSARAGIVVYDEGDKKVEVGGRIQLEYAYADPDLDGDADDDSRDRLFFRRLRPYLSGTVTKNWFGKIEFDFGEALDSEEVALKDVYMRYSGFSGQDLKLTFGNAKPPFSREFNISSATLQTVERGFAGDHNFGSPDRTLGVKLDGKTASKKLAYAATVGMESHDPDVRFLDFDSPVNSRNDWNEGLLVAGRVDLHPLGELAYETGDFERGESRFTVGLAGYNWHNDDDNNAYTVGGIGVDPERADLQDAWGVELAGTYRGHGLSVDVQLQHVDAETVDPAFTGGIYVGGGSELEMAHALAGYMAIKERLEVVLGWDSLDTDGYEDRWERQSVGLNLFFSRHNLKLQGTWWNVRNTFGVRGDDRDALFLMLQFVF